MLRKPEFVERTHENGICLFTRLQSGLGKRFACRIDRTSSKKMCLKFELNVWKTGRYGFKDFYGFSSDLGACRSQGQPVVRRTFQSSIPMPSPGSTTIRNLIACKLCDQDQVNKVGGLYIAHDFGDILKN